ncbi:MAG: coproporphyrinogen III oxidase [Desulfuromonas sp.]|nr:MAG: coproporphyrinogen III oxidase [Desulfuromonas sp.]
MTGLYFHIPFCLRKCPYCDFFSVEKNEGAVDAYGELLRKDLERAAANGWQGPVDTLFFGGGTPSLLAPGVVADLLQGVAKHFGLSAEAEISLEANPGTVDAQKLQGYRAAGVNRLSLGMQSLQPNLLAKLGRPHSVAESREAVRLARQAGFDNLSLDLMFALPGQSRTELENDLDALLEFEPEHLSCYGLTAETGTPLGEQVAGGKIVLPDEDLYAELFLRVDARLTAAGYRHYEISNFARPGYACRHNQGYWQRLPCLGLGAGAHSFVATGWGERRAVAADLDRYAENVTAGRDTAQTIETFDREGAMAEMLYLGLRTDRGVDAETFRAAFGVDLQMRYADAIARCDDMLVCEEGRWRFNIDGWLLFNTLLSHFL